MRMRLKNEWSLSSANSISTAFNTQERFTKRSHLIPRSVVGKKTKRYGGQGLVLISFPCRVAQKQCATREIFKKKSLFNQILTHLGFVRCMQYKKLQILYLKLELGKPSFPKESFNHRWIMRHIFRNWYY